MSVSNNLIHLCLEIPHCAHQCALPKLSLLVCVVCSCSLFSDLATFFLASLLNYPFLSLRLSDVFLTSSVAPTISVSLCYCSLTLGIFSLSSLLFSRRVYSTSLQHGHKRAEHITPEQMSQVIYSSSLPSKGAWI